MPVGEPFVDVTAERSAPARAFGEGARRCRALASRDLAATMAIDPGALAGRKLAYLSIVTMHFCITAGLAADVAPRVLGSYYRALWTGDSWRARPADLDARTPAYEDALNHPHPDYGRGYGVGRTFARLCGATHDLPVIEFGARAYVEQLPPILTLLRGVVVR